MNLPLKRSDLAALLGPAASPLTRTLDGKAQQVRAREVPRARGTAEHGAHEDPLPSGHLPTCSLFWVLG